jgi:HEAT repeat protein
MKKYTFFLLILALAAGSFSASAAEKIPLSDALRALSTWESGQSREALTVISESLRAASADPETLGAIEERLVALLPAVSTDAKRFICRELDVIGTAKCVPALAAFLTDEAAGDTALHTLETIPGPEALEALHQALAKAPDAEKGRYITALGRRGSSASVARLRSYLEGGDPALAAAAAGALAQIGGAGCGLVLNAADAAPESMREDIYNAALRCAGNLLAAGNTEEAAAIYEKFFTAVRPPHIRIAALGGLVKAEPETAGDRVLVALNDPEPLLSRAALEHVRLLPADLVETSFGKRLDPEGGPETIRLIHALADRESGAPVEALIACAEKGGKDVKMAAVKALGKVGDVSCVPVLIDTAAHGIGAIYRAGRESLSTLPGAEVNGVLLELAVGGQAEEQAEALNALADRRAFAATPQILELAASGKDETRKNALKALENLADTDDLNALFQILRQADDENRGAAADAITAVARRIPDAEERTRLIAAQLEDAPAPVKIVLIDILSRVPAAPVLPVLGRYLDGPAEEVRLAAVAAMASWPDGAPLVLLAPRIGKAEGSEKEAIIDACAGLLRNATDRSDADRLALYRRLLEEPLSGAQKKTILAGLASIIHPDALAMAAACGKDSGIEAEAAVAVIRIAKGLSGAYPEKARKAVAPWLAEDADEGLRQQAEEVENAINGMQGWCTAWQVTGPYRESGKSAHQLFAEQLPPETQPENAIWRIMPMALNREMPWAIDLASAFGGSECVAYLRTTVESAAADEAVIELGSNDMVKVWLNGEKVHAFGQGRPMQPGQDVVKVQLREGANALLMAVYQLGGAWSACLRFQNPEGIYCGID